MMSMNGGFAAEIDKHKRGFIRTAYPDRAGIPLYGDVADLSKGTRPCAAPCYHKGEAKEDIQQVPVSRAKT